MNQNEENTQPLLIRPVPPTAERIDKKKFLAVFAVLGLVLVLVFGVKLQKKFAATQGVQPPAATTCKGRAPWTTSSQRPPPTPGWTGGPRCPLPYRHQTCHPK
jgi:hypothetical protein